MNNVLPPIRMVFEMARDEHPRLYDDLIRFPKGTKRINRLRTLAHDGLLFQINMEARHTETKREACGEVVPSARAMTSQIFDEPLNE